LEISKRLGIKAGVFLTQHDDPLGYCVGNQLEVEETIEGLYGNLSPDIEELVTKYGGYLLQRVKIANTMKDGQRIILEKLKNGEALAKFRDMIVGQGVSKEIANELCNRNYDVFPAKAKYLSTIKAKDTGMLE
jgi:pyrimidine-nucleoside phosphorylase